MSYPSVNFKVIENFAGAQGIDQTSTTQVHPLGMVVRAADVTYGAGQFIYLQGVASTAAGDLVFYDNKAGTTVRALHGGTGCTGPCAVAMSANVASQYGWYCISGAVPVNTAATVLGNFAAYLTATAGQIDDNAVSGDLVGGMVFKETTTGGFSTCQLDAPSTIALADTGTNTGDVTLGTFGAAPDAKGATISGQVVTLQPADGTHPGLLTTGAQTIGGAKTFSSTVAASNLSGTNTGDVTLAAVGSTPSDNGASLSSQVLTLQPADATHPGLLTVAAQAVAGVKTFSDIPVFSAGIGVTTGANKTIGTSAAMVAGSKTISTTAVTASSLIFLTHAGSDVTHAGVLSVGTIVAATSFVINSTDGADVDTVNWWIVN